jgi:protease II
LSSKKIYLSEHLYAEGGSAGGLLMGVVLNMARYIME